MAAPIGQGYSFVDPRQADAATAKGTNTGLAINALAQTTGLPLLGSSSGSAGGFNGVGGAGYPSTVAMPDSSGATSAAFARGKDQAGESARAAVNALNDEMGSQQMLGSGQHAQQLGQVVNHANAGVNELTREQAIQNATMANDNAKTQYQGNITQRGQNINAAQEAARMQQQQMQGLLSAMGGLY